MNSPTARHPTNSGPAPPWNTQLTVDVPHRRTPYSLTCADGKTYTKKTKNKSMSPVTCQQSQQQKPQTVLLLTPPLCTLHSKVVHQSRIVNHFGLPKPMFFFSFAILAIQSSTRSCHLSWFRLMTEGTNTQTDVHCNLLYLIGLGADLVKML